MTENLHLSEEHFSVLMEPVPGTLLTSQSDLDLSPNRNLAEQIRSAIDQSTSMMHARKAATEFAVRNALVAGNLLIQAKRMAGHGNFAKWLEINLSDVSRRTVSRYMKLARNWPQVANLTVQPISLGKAYQALEEINCPLKLAKASQAGARKSKSEKERILGMGLKIKKFVIRIADEDGHVDECIQALEQMIPNLKKLLGDLKARNL